MEQFAIDFFVVGAARSGTTSLYQYLKQHPNVFLSEVKELNHFSEVESNDHSDYKTPKKGESYHTKIIKSSEIYESLFSEAGPEQKKGDISPSYLWGNTTAQRIYSHNPEAKIIITLRNPIDRAFSHYVMNYGVGYDREDSFRKALNAKLDRVWGGGNLYVEWSTYFDAVKSYYDTFPREQIKLLVFEDWTRNRDQTLRDIFQFLGIESTIDIDHDTQHNKKTAYKNIGLLNFLRGRFIKNVVKALIPHSLRDRVKDRYFSATETNLKLDDQLRAELKQQFEEDVRKLQELTGIHLLEKWGFTEGKKAKIE
ncbi:MAG: sulfotransferase [Aureisphaera sp.]